MSSWLLDGEVLMGEGRGELSPCSPRVRGTMKQRAGRGWGQAVQLSPREKAPEAATPQHDVLGKVTELFLLCDKEGKGFITKRDMQRLQGELPLTPEQLESVFDSLDQERNGFLTPVEFRKGLRELLRVPEEEPEAKLRLEGVEMVDSDEQRFMQILQDLGIDSLLKDRWEVHGLWCGLQRDHPEMLYMVEELLSYVVPLLRDALKEKENLEQALHRRDMDHDQVVRSIYEEMETRVREEKEKYLAQNSVRESDRCQQLQEELRMKEQELENAAAKQRELEDMVHMLTSEQVDTKVQNQKLHNLNLQLQEQLEAGRLELESALSQLHHLQSSSVFEQRGRERDVLKVSKNMQKEKESLTRQLDLLREINKRLRDEKDVHQSQKRIFYRSSVPAMPQLSHCSWESNQSLWLQPLSPYWPRQPLDQNPNHFLGL